MKIVENFNNDNIFILTYPYKIMQTILTSTSTTAFYSTGDYFIYIFCF